MAYKTCENCGSRVFEHGCVNCNEMEYISMQEEYIPPSNPKEPETVHGNEAEKEVFYCADRKYGGTCQAQCIHCVYTVKHWKQ